MKSFGTGQREIGMHSSEYETLQDNDSEVMHGVRLGIIAVGLSIFIKHFSVVFVPKPEDLSDYKQRVHYTSYGSIL